MNVVWREYVCTYVASLSSLEVGMAPGPARPIGRLAQILSFDMHWRLKESLISKQRNESDCEKVSSSSHYVHTTTNCEKVSSSHVRKVQSDGLIPFEKRKKEKKVQTTRNRRFDGTHDWDWDRESVDTVVVIYLSFFCSSSSSRNLIHHPNPNPNPNPMPCHAMPCHAIDSNA
jgi:hypothetical protein